MLPSSRPQKLPTKLPAMPETPFRCGTVAIVGRPNVGKSTLLNRILGVTLSITSHKPQTTRHRLLGIHTTTDTQYLFIDTPGFQLGHKSALNRVMNRTVRQVLAEVDVVLFVVDATRFGQADQQVLKLLPASRPVILVINKVDRLEDKLLLLPYIEQRNAEFAYAEAVPVSARRNLNLGELLAAVRRYLPEQPAIYGKDELTDRNECFLAAELLREKVFRLVGDELPYKTTVEIEKFEQEGTLRRIHAAIIVDKEGQKPILIGKQGQRLKRISSEARQDMENLFGGKVWLETWVKVRSGWADDEQALKSLGY